MDIQTIMLGGDLTANHKMEQAGYGMLHFPSRMFPEFLRWAGLRVTLQYVPVS